MDAQPPSLEKPPATPAPKRRRALRRVLFVFVFVVFVLALIVCLVPSQEPQFVWLTPAQAAQANRVGPLTLLKYKLMRMAGPLMRYYHSHRPNIMISSSVLVLPPTMAELTSLGPPNYTDAGRERAWIVSSAELAVLHRQLKTGPSPIMTPRILTGDGMRALATIGQTMTVAAGVVTNVGTIVDIVAKSSHGSVNLLLAVSSTSLGGPQTGSPAAILTNFSVACRVLVPDAGAVVVNCGNAVDTNNSTNYWLIVSPVLVDATGKPIKH